MRITSVSGKVLASVTVVAAAAAVAGLGTFGTFTSTTSASQSVTTGTVSIALGANGAANRLSVAATGLVPGDTVSRAVNLSNTGNQGLSSITLSTAATTSSVLDTDTANGLQLKVERCSVPWTEAGTAPAYTYTCSGTRTSVLTERPVIGSNLALANLGSLSTGTDHLVTTLTLPTAADNTFQGKSSVIGLTFTGTQRAATAQ